jgi:hypothetical protein
VAPSLTNQVVNSTGTGTATSFTLTAPAGSGGWLLAIVVVRNTTAPTITGTDWILVTEAYNSGVSNGLRHMVYRAAAGAGNLTLTLGVARNWIGAAWRVADGDTTTPIETSSQQANASSLNHDTPGLTCSADALLVWGTAFPGSTATITGPSGMTTVVNQSATAVRHEIKSEVRSAGATADPLRGTTSSGQADATIALSLKAAASSADRVPPRMRTVADPSRRMIYEWN